MSSRPTKDDRRWMGLAIDLAHQCPPSQGAYSVGAVSRENDPHVHAEEAALAKLPGKDPRLILHAGIGRVVIAWREPSLFVADCQGTELLQAAGVAVIERPGFAERAMAMNSHLSLGT